MKRCHYCGKEAEDTTELCPGCGTALPEAPPSPSGPIDLPPVIPKPILNASRATQIFVIMFLAQILGAMAAGIIVVAIAAAHGADLSDSRHTAELVNTSPLTLSAAVVASAIATIAGSLLLVRPALKDTSPAGAAWVLGSRKDLLKALCLGVAVALGSVMINTALSTVIHPQFGPLTRMALTPGVPQVTFIVLAVLIVPAPEELLFRGVMYGGYLQSFGPRIAMLLTTGLFL